MGSLSPADAGFALILAHREGRFDLTTKAGSFAGQLAVGMTPLTDRQRAWLVSLAEKAGLPPLALGGDA